MSIIVVAVTGGYVLSGAVVSKHHGNLVVYIAMVAVLTAASLGANLVGMMITYNHSLDNAPPKSRVPLGAVTSLAVALMFGLTTLFNHQHGANAGYVGGALESIWIGFPFILLVLAHQALAIQKSRSKKPHEAARQQRATSRQSGRLGDGQRRERPRRHRRPNHKTAD